MPAYRRENAGALCQDWPRLPLPDDLSYREEPLLGRALTVRELREVSDMARRIAALLSLAEALDASYARARG